MAAVKERAAPARSASVPMMLHAPAKINLTLEVLQRRDDGYHALRSLMVPLAFGDTVSIVASDRFSFACSDKALETADNLVVRAARAVAPEPNVAIDLHKRIPTQAGLGGGSSDAAAVLVGAMNGAFGSVSERDWVAAARELGSDVPFFLCGTGALVEGTGERVTAVGALPAWHVLIVKPPVAVSTAAAYAALDKVNRSSRPRNASVSLAALDALQRGDFAALEATLTNDFHETIAAANPEVALAIEALRAAGASKPLLCGSGSAVFALAESAAEVTSMQSRLDLDETFARIATCFMETPQWARSAR
jgi:4-diphosphocytidyl-2C-methyl-D-erythritol kinase